MRVQVRVKAGGRGARLYLEVPEELVELAKALLEEGTKETLENAIDAAAYLERLGEAVLPAVLFAAGAEVEVPGAVAMTDGTSVRTDIRAAPIPLSAGKE